MLRASKYYMIIWLNGVPYHYCAIPPNVVQEFEAAHSMGTYYNENIRSKPSGEHGPFDCRDHPFPVY